MKASRSFQIDKKWKFLDRKSPVFSSDKIQPEIIKILTNRGIKSEKEALDFLSPSYEKLADPYQLPDMKEAVKMIITAVEDKRKIAIYGDYDVDGIAATAILVKFFRKINAEVIYYVPSREDEGYGLHKKAITQLKKEKVSLIITVDCGSMAIEEVDYVKKLGLDIIVTDHHALGVSSQKVTLPKTLIINPKRCRRNDSFYNLSGAGVAFYLVRALQKHFLEVFPAGQEKWLLDLVALGTICDVVPLLSDNRILAKFGLLVLSKSRHIGLGVLAKVTEMNLVNVDSHKIGFIFGPRLNASGRLENAQKSLELLLTEDQDKAFKIAKNLNELNMKRQEITEKIVAEAKEFIAQKNYDKDRKILLLANKNWPAGVVGIAASRLVEEYSRPVLVMEEAGQELRGSARSISRFNIIEALSKCSECFIQFGGHAQAAGFKLKKKHLLLLDEKLLAITEKEIKASDLQPEIFVIGEIMIKNIDRELVKELQKLEPYGTDNYKPVFVKRGAKIEEADLVGSGKNHLRLILSEEGTAIGGIAFKFGKEYKLKTGDIIDLAFTIEINEWKNRQKIDLHIIDVKKNK
jgi:single-stranded-DNA-specific exonuclease